MPHSSEVLDAVVRRSYGKLLGFLVSRADGAIADAEDALGEALESALRQWPVRGIPRKPEAWLLTVARRRFLDIQRRQGRSERLGPEIIESADAAETESFEMSELPDERLKLLFVCAHPAIDEGIRTPLMLQMVLGLEAQSIASAFLCAPAAMAQRLVRAKAKIRAARIRLEVPEARAWPERMSYVLDAVYAGFTLGWPQFESEDLGNGLAEEAIRLGDILTGLAPREPEALGLLALMLFSHARRKARRDAAGRYVPLDSQNTDQWDHAMLDRAEVLLNSAATFSRPGRFQLEAAIQSAHAARRRTGRTEWRGVAELYGVLLTLAPTVGARIGHAVAVSRVKGAEQGLALLQSIPRDRVETYQPWWAAQAQLLKEADRLKEARDAFRRAIGLCEDPAAREYLLGKSHEC